MEAVLAIWRSGFQGIAGQVNGDGRENGPGGANRQGLGGSFTRPDLVIPCRVAPQHCSAPFHQASLLYHKDSGDVTGEDSHKIDPKDST